MSAVYDKKILYQIYKTATDTPFSFLYINLMTQDKSEMFFKNFEEQIIPKSKYMEDVLTFTNSNNYTIALTFLELKNILNN